jgi:mannitol 2-dehydrogenase
MTRPIPLSQATLGLIGERTLKHRAGRVPVPAYDRALVTPGVVPIGVGGFHRAHQAMYHDQLLNQGAALDWGICGVGMLPGDMRMRQVLHDQNGLYTLVLKHNDGTWEPRVIGSIVEYLDAPDDPEAVIEKMAAPATRIVSLTITEGGYNLNDTTGEFDKHNPAVTCDLAPGAVPRTMFGLVTEALRRRRVRGLAPSANRSRSGYSRTPSRTAGRPTSGPGCRSWAM